MKSTCSAGLPGQLIPRVIQPQAQYAATNTASLTSMQLAMSGKAPATLVAAEFTQQRVVDVPGLEVVILDSSGTVLYTSECDGTTLAVRAAAQAVAPPPVPGISAPYSAPSDYVFASAAGTGLGYRNVERRGLRRAAEAAGIEQEGLAPPQAGADAVGPGADDRDYRHDDDEHWDCPEPHSVCP